MSDKGAPFLSKECLPSSVKIVGVVSSSDLNPARDQYIFEDRIAHIEHLLPEGVFKLQKNYYADGDVHAMWVARNKSVSASDFSHRTKAWPDVTNSYDHIPAFTEYFGRTWASESQMHIERGAHCKPHNADKFMVICLPSQRKKPHINSFDDS